MNETIQRIKQQMMADRKKLSLMASLAAVMLLLWGRLLLKQVPRTAVADPAASTAAAQTANGSSSQSAAEFVMGPSVYVNLPSVVKRDLFQFDRSRFSKLEPDPGTSVPEKSPADSSEEQKRKLIEDIRQWVDTLVYQGGIMGEKPQAMINNKIYKQGEKINGFTITKVMPRQVVMERDGIEIILPMSE